MSYTSVLYSPTCSCREEYSTGKEAVRQIVCVHTNDWQWQEYSTGKEAVRQIVCVHANDWQWQEYSTGKEAER